MPTFFTITSSRVVLGGVGSEFYPIYVIFTQLHLFFSNQNTTTIDGNGAPFFAFPNFSRPLINLISALLYI